MKRLTVLEAEAAYQAGDLERAEVLSRTLLKCPDFKSVGCHLLGAIFLKRKQPKDAVQWLEQAIAGGYALPTVLNNCGEGYRQLGDLDKAFRYFESALKIDNNNPYPHFNLGLVMRSWGHAREAEHFFQTAIALNSSMSRAYFELAELYREEGHSRESESAYREAISISDRENVSGIGGRKTVWRTRLASLLRGKGDPFAAIEILSDIPEAEKQADAHMELALCYFEIGWENIAEKSYFAAVKLNPSMSRNNVPKLVMPRITSIKEWCESGKGRYVLLGKPQYLSLPSLKVIPAQAASHFMPSDVSAAPELFCAALTGAEVLPLDFAVVSEGRFFSEGVINWDLHYARKGHLSKHESDDGRLLLDVPAQTRVHKGACVLLGGGADNYEWLFETLARLWVIEQLPELAELPLIVPADLSDAQISMLDRLGVTGSRLLMLNETETLSAEILHVPSLLTIGNWVSPVALQYIRRHFGSHSGKGRRRLYLSRSGMPDRRLANEQEILPILESRGFECLRTDQLDPLALMAAFSEAEIVIGIDDDTLANIVVAPQGARVGIITTGGTHRARAHFICGQIAIDATYMIGEIKFDSNTVHALCDVTLSESILAEFLGNAIV